MSKRQKIDPGMPWGWWLTRDGNEVRDDNGKTWPSVTAALFDELWPKCGWREAPRNTEEHLLRALEVIDEDGQINIAAKEQLFHGNQAWSDWFGLWLVEVGLAREDEDYFTYLSLTPRGQSVLKMLRHVRADDRETLSMRDIRLDVGAKSSVSEKTLAKVEEIQAKWPPKADKVFRDTIGHQHVVKFSHFDQYTKDSGGMPMSRVVWSMGFRDEASRDHFFAWMCERSFHWDSWGKLAHYHGARALTDRLLRIMVQEKAA